MKSKDITKLPKLDYMAVVRSQEYTDAISNGFEDMTGVQHPAAVRGRFLYMAPPQGSSKEGELEIYFEYRISNRTIEYNANGSFKIIKNISSAQEGLSFMISHYQNFMTNERDALLNKINNNLNDKQRKLINAIRINIPEFEFMNNKMDPGTTQVEGIYKSQEVKIWTSGGDYYLVDFYENGKNFHPLAGISQVPAKGASQLGDAIKKSYLQCLNRLDKVNEYIEYFSNIPNLEIETSSSDNEIYFNEIYFVYNKYMEGIIEIQFIRSSTINVYRPNQPMKSSPAIFRESVPYQETIEKDKLDILWEKYKNSKFITYAKNRGIDSLGFFEKILSFNEYKNKF